MSGAGRAAAGLMGAGVVLAGQRLLTGTDERSARWWRTNHRGEPVSLYEGPLLAAGSLAGLALVPGLPLRARLAAIAATATAAGLGAYDDQSDVRDAVGPAAKGFRGHLGALRSGRVTSGTRQDRRDRGVRPGGGRAPAAERRRMDRAACGRDGGRRDREPAEPPGPPAGARAQGRAADGRTPCGPARARRCRRRRRARGGDCLAPEDLGERSMLGDCGANAWEPWLAAASPPGPARRGCTPLPRHSWPSPQPASASASPR